MCNKIISRAIRDKLKVDDQEKDQVSSQYMELLQQLYNFWHKYTSSSKSKEEDFLVNKSRFSNEITDYEEDIALN